MTFEVACETAVAADPGQRPLDDPALGQDFEAMEVGALDDLQDPGAGSGRGRPGLRPLIAAVGEDALDEGEQPPGAPVEHLGDAVAVLHIRRMDGDVQQETEGVDQDVALAARDLLRGIEALWVERRAPF